MRDVQVGFQVCEVLEEKVDFFWIVPKEAGWHSMKETLFNSECSDNRLIQRFLLSLNLEGLWVKLTAPGSHGP